VNILPTSLSNIFGRDDIICTLSKKLLMRRFLTIVGTGGIGKTTVATAVAAAIEAERQYQTSFVDLAAIQDPELVNVQLCSALGLPADLDAALDYLKGNHVLLLLDNCEHLIDRSAKIAELVLRQAPFTLVLATSREQLGAQGEWVHRLPALECPPPCTAMTVREALRFPAIQLFVERSRAANQDFLLKEAEVSDLVRLCRNLDGLPLAIELAAPQTTTFNIGELATHINTKLAFLGRNRRTAPTRHQSIHAALDWSYDLLRPEIQTILRRISLSAGQFDSEIAIALAGDALISNHAVLQGLAELIAKSLVNADTSQTSTSYRLLETTRVYALEKLRDANEFTNIQKRRVQFCCLWSGYAPQNQQRAIYASGVYARKLNELRSALEWCFSDEGDVPSGVALTMCSVHWWFHFSRGEEYRAWCEKALSALANNSRALCHWEPELSILLVEALTVLNGLSQHDQVFDCAETSSGNSKQPNLDISWERSLGFLLPSHREAIFRLTRQIQES
jgi:predicted ATPase